MIQAEKFEQLGIFTIGNLAVADRDWIKLTFKEIKKVEEHETAICLINSFQLMEPISRRG